MTVARCLTIATSDSGGGAGIQADLKAFAAAGCHGMSALVALTAQSTVGVRAIHELPASFILAQLDAVGEDIGVDAAKTGMLFSAPIIEAVAGWLEPTRFPLVVDPVMVASSGARLLREDAVSTLVRRLFPRATVITPNLPEAEALTGHRGSRRELAERLRESIPELDVLYVSGFTDDDAVRMGAFPPGSKFLQKPFTLGALVSKVREALDA